MCHATTTCHNAESHQHAPARHLPESPEPQRKTSTLHARTHARTHTIWAVSAVGSGQWAQGSRTLEREGTRFWMASIIMHIAAPSMAAIVRCSTSVMMSPKSTTMMNADITTCVSPQEARVKTRSSRRPVRSYASAAPRHIYATRSPLLSPSARDSLSPGASLGARGTGSVGHVVGQGHVGA